MRYILEVRIIPMTTISYIRKIPEIIPIVV